jgi:hypothetical protein
MHRYFREVLCAPQRTEQAGYEHLLRGLYRGTWVGEGEGRRLISWSATAAEIYDVARQEWEATRSAARHATTTTSHEET